MVTSIRWISLVAIAALICAGSANAEAKMGRQTNPSNSKQSVTLASDGQTTDGGGGKTIRAGGCSLYGNPDGFGVVCAGGKGGFSTVKQILGRDRLPSCWDEELSVADLDRVVATDREDFGYYWQRCLTGIDPKTLTVEADGVSFTQELVTFPKPVLKCPPGKLAKPAGSCVVSLSARQRRLVAIQGADELIPFPVAVPSPIPKVRVNADVSFSDGSETSIGPVIQSGAGVGTVRMQARVIGFSVSPTGDDGAKIRCAGGGVLVSAGDTPSTVPGACWYRYLESSARQPDFRYPVSTTAIWQIRYTSDAAKIPWRNWTLLNTVTKTQVTQTPVVEIQTLVVN
jgi:hypothetical protein